MVLRTYGGCCPYSINQYVYTDDVNFNPNTIYSGTTWERIKGRCLVGVDESQSEFSSVKKLGGSKTETLTTAQMPVHSHGITSNNPSNLIGASGKQIGAEFLGSYTYDRYSTSKTGGGQAHNNLQPYKTTYIWVRTK